MYEKNPLRHLKPSALRNRMAGRIATKPSAEFSPEAIKEKYRLLEIEKQNRRPAGPGLKEYMVDTNQIHGFESVRRLMYCGVPHLEHSMYQALQDEKRKHPEIKDPDILENTGHRLYAAAIMSGNGVDRGLKDWMSEHTPQKAYFTPEMVAEAVKDRSDIHVETGERDGLSTWNFSFDSTGESFEMSRTADGSEPQIPTNPYLLAQYWNEYDFESEEIVSTPRFSDATGVMTEHPVDNYGILNGEFGQALKQALDLNPVRVQQRIEFTFEGPQSKAFLTPLAGGLEPEYLRVPSSVTAHLPGAEL